MQRGLAAWLMAALVLTGCSKATPPPVAERNVTTPAPYQPGEKHRQALALIGNEKNQEAEAILRALVAEEPGNADAWNDLSFVQAKLMRYSDAVDSAQVALPDRPEPLYALGRWYEQDGDKDQALTFYRKAAAMDYEPAKRSAAYLSDQERRPVAADEAVARFLHAPPGVIRGVMGDYIPEGVTRKIVQVMQVQFDDKQPPLWAALVFDDYRTSVMAKVMVLTANADGSFLDGYMGTCDLSSRSDEVQAQLQSLPYAHGEHLMVQVPGETIICGFKGEYVTVVYRTKASASVTSGGLDVSGQLLRFVPETSEYLPVAGAEKLLALIGEVRAAGATLKTTEAVTVQVDVTGKPAQALAWQEATGRDYRLMIAVKPDGEPAILHTAGKEVMFVTPYAVGQVMVPGHTFLAVATHQKGAPNGGDVLVLEYDKAKGSFRKVFHGMSDSAGFSDKDVSTTFKKYRPQGGFDLYTTTYIWDEARGTFVGSKTVEAPVK